MKGRLITIGYTGGYKSNNRESINVSNFGDTIPVRLLMKSASIHGFFLFHYANEWQKTFEELSHLYESGELKVCIDTGSGVDQKYDHDGDSDTKGGKTETLSENFKFKGLEEIPNAVDYLYSRNSVGKIVVEI